MPRVADLDNRRQALKAFIARHRRRPFAWGTADCCLTVADALIARGEQDFARDLRGYSNRFGAFRALRRAGFLSVGEVLRARFKPTTRARVGTVVMLRGTAPLDVLMIADGAQSCWGQAETGLERFPIPDGAKLWEA